LLEIYIAGDRNFGLVDIAHRRLGGKTVTGHKNPPLKKESNCSKYGITRVCIGDKWKKVFGSGSDKVVRMKNNTKLGISCC
jgi:hypothetical protein